MVMKGLIKTASVHAVFKLTLNMQQPDLATWLMFVHNSQMDGGGGGELLFWSQRREVIWQLTTQAPLVWMVRAVTDAITELFWWQTQARVLALALELGHVTGLTESCAWKEQTEAILGVLWLPVTSPMQLLPIITSHIIFCATSRIDTHRS